MQIIYGKLVMENDQRELRRCTDMKSFYVAVQIEETGKYYAYAVKVSENDDLLSNLEIKGIKTANLCETKKRAETIVKAWNAAYKANGNYLFDSPSF
jgi:hypothetical protein